MCAIWFCDVYCRCIVYTRFVIIRSVRVKQTGNVVSRSVHYCIISRNVTAISTSRFRPWLFFMVNYGRSTRNIIRCVLWTIKVENSVTINTDKIIINFERCVNILNEEEMREGEKKTERNRVTMKQLWVRTIYYATYYFYL